MVPRVDQARPSAVPNAGRTELNERSRDRILTVALEEFATRGFDGTTTAEIARQAGVTQPLVHYYFASKDALWRAAVTSAFVEASRAYDGVLEELADLDPVDRMKVLVRRYVRFSALHPEIGRIVSSEGVLGGPRLDWLVDHQVRNGFDGFERLFEQAAADGLVKALPPENVLSCLSAAGAYLFMIRAAMRDIHGIDVTDPAVIEAHADTVVEIFFHGLVRQADRA